MAITNNDIRIFQSQDNTDNDSGGGARTSNEIVDGDVNNLFPDISRIDTVSGDVALRKVFPTVVTSNNDIYYGAHSIIRKKPTDDNVSALLFHSDDPFDKRLSAQNDIESYLVASYTEEFYLYGNHVSGSRSVTFLQSVNQRTPVVGEVYLLVDGAIEQYIRVSNIDESIINVTYASGASFTSYERRRIICTIDQPLTYAFTGSVFNPAGVDLAATQTFATQVANAAKFYGTRPTTVLASAGSLTIQADTIFETLVPSTKVQTAIVNKDPTKGINVVASSSVGVINKRISFTNGAFTGSLNIGVTPLSLTSAQLSDDGKGVLVDNVGTIVGTIDYENGDIITNSSWGTSGTLILSFIPMVTAKSKISYTGSVQVTSGNQGFTYVNNLNPIPSSGQLYIDYRSQGKWYTLSLNSDNTIDAASPLLGSGNLQDNGDNTGTVSLTLGALPDIDSSILYSWGSSRVMSDRSTLIDQGLNLVIDLQAINVDPLSLSAVIEGGTITADAAGVLSDTSGTITGTLDSAKGKLLITGHSVTNRFSDNVVGGVDLTFNHASSTDVGVGVGSDVIQVVSETPAGGEIGFTSIDRLNGNYSFALGVSVNNSTGIEMSIKTRYPDTTYSSQAGTEPDNILTGFNERLINLVSDESGVLRLKGSQGLSATSYGSVLADGTVSIDFTKTYFTKVFQEAVNPPLGGSYIRYDETYLKEEMVAGVSFSVSFRKGGALAFPTSVTNSIYSLKDVASYEIALGVGFIAGEVLLRVLDNTDSILYNTFSKNGLMYLTDSVTSISQVGSFDKQKGIVTLDYYTSPRNFVMIPFVLFTAEYGSSESTQNIFDFRTDANKLLASSFQLRYSTNNGAFSATTDANGMITGTDILASSFIEPDTGMVHIEFNTVFADISGFKYDAVAETSLPLDPELLGLNPVRLPVDGRVPIFQKGMQLVIFNEATTATTNATPLAGDVETLARSGQAYIEVVDANGKRLNSIQYVADKALGTVTFNAGLVLEDKYNVLLTAPFAIIDRIEDMVAATDVEINGIISLSAPLANTYPANTSYIASTLVWGDTGSRVYNLFSQEIWDNNNPVWSDLLIGDPTTSQYDTINSALTITNADSTSGRWAIIFTGSTTVSVAHEKLGIVQTGISISTNDVAPINPATGLPYFIMLKAGFGGGWVVNNVIRFNTDSGDNNMWVIRTVQAGALTEQTDNIEIEIRGDAN